MVSNFLSFSHSSTLLFSHYFCREHEFYHHHLCDFSIHCCGAGFFYRVCFFFFDMPSHLPYPESTSFIGTILQKSKFIKTYLIMHYIFLSFQICYLVALYITRNQSLDDCLDGTTSQGKIDYCNAIRVFKDYPKVYALSNIIVPRVIVIQLCEFTLPTSQSQYSDPHRTDACYLVRSYSLLLERQGFKKNRQFNRVPGQPVNHHDENYHKSAYPYRSRK